MKPGHGRKRLQVTLILGSLLLPSCGDSNISSGNPPSGPIAETGSSKADQTFDAKVYPAPASMPDWGFESGCPSPAGLQPLVTSDETAMVEVVNAFGRDQDADKRASDRAYWPIIERYYQSRPTPSEATGGTLVGELTPVDELDLVDLLRRCGSTVLEGSKGLLVCDQGLGDCNLGVPGRVRQQQVWIKRQGQLLLWFSK